MACRDTEFDDCEFNNYYENKNDNGLSYFVVIVIGSSDKL